VPFIQSLILDWPTSLELLGSFLNNADLSRLDSLSVAGSSWLEEVGDLVRFNRLSAQLRSLTCGGRSNFRTQALDSQLDPPDLSEALAKSPLEHLACFDSGLTADGLRTLLTAPFAATLKHLDISDNPIAPDAYLAFEQAHRSLRLDKLDVSGTPLAGISLPHLLLAQSLEDLTRLEMNGCGSAMRNMAAVAHSPFWTQAVELRAHSGTIPASTFEPLARSPGPPALRLLDLADNYLRTEGVRMLCDAPWAGSLTWLALSANYLDDEACEVLAESGRFTSLRTLHLAHNNVRQEGGEGEQITDRGVRALAAHPSLANLRLLSLSNTGITHRGVEAAVNAPHWRLFGLGVAGCELSPEVVRTLAESPRLARFVWLDLADNPRLRGDALRPLAESPYLSRMCELDCGGIDVAPDVQHLFRERLGPRFSH
jgi:Ran GTPase-activating protein (RanGAP) involved in mRNA processing and transport